MKVVQHWIRRLQRYAKRWWYAPLLGSLAAADSFIIVVPTDGLLVSGVLLAPRRWLYTAVMVALGSTVGAWLLAYALEIHGLPFLLKIVPEVQQTKAWLWSDQLMDQWGLWALFLVSLSPLMQHPAVALAALAGMPLSEIFFTMLAGRGIKYFALAWVTSHAPNLLGKLWGIQGDLKEAGVKAAPDGEPRVLKP